MGERLILMGVIGRPHGVRGLVRVNVFAGDPAVLADYPLVDKAGRRFALAWAMAGVAQLGEVTSAGVRKITDRNEAERLVNLELFAQRSVLPALDEEEFYLADLIGLAAQDGAGTVLGTISAVHDYGGGTSIEISPLGLIVPFTKAAVPVVDIAGGHVVVAPPVETEVRP